MATKKARRPCVICNAPVEGKGAICAKCASANAVGGDAARRVADKIKGRLAAGETGGFVCPFCRAELSWENVGTTETEVSIYVREKIYFCPSCRAFLGVSSWHTEG